MAPWFPRWRPLGPALGDTFLVNHRATAGAVKPLASRHRLCSSRCPQHMLDGSAAVARVGVSPRRGVAVAPSPRNMLGVRVIANYQGGGLPVAAVGSVTG